MMKKNDSRVYKQQQRTAGAFVKVPFDKKYHTYARILNAADYAFYDCKTTEDIDDMHNIASRPILFQVAVHKYAVTRGRWLKVGKLPLEEELKVIPLKFIQDSIDPRRFRLYDPNTGKMWPASREECEGLERAAVWEPEHVEERLRAHYEGRLNKRIEHKEIKD